MSTVRLLKPGPPAAAETCPQTPHPLPASCVLNMRWCDGARHKVLFVDFFNENKSLEKIVSVLIYSLSDLYFENMKALNTF